MDEVTADIQPVDDKPPEPEFVILDALPDAPILDAGDVLAHLKAAGIDVDGDTVMARADGSVAVAAVDDKALAAAWATYEPPAPAQRRTTREDLESELSAITTIDDLQAFIRDRLIPLIAPE